MLDGFVPWPPQVAQRWRDAGHWAGRPVANIVRDAAARWPAQVALIEGERQLTYAQLAATVDLRALIASPVQGTDGSDDGASVQAAGFDAHTVLLAHRSPSKETTLPDSGAGDLR